MNIYNFNKISHAVKSTLTNLKSDFSFLKKLMLKMLWNNLNLIRKVMGKAFPILIKEPGKMIFFRYFFESNSTDIIDAINDSIKTSNMEELELLYSFRLGIHKI